MTKTSSTLLKKFKKENEVLLNKDSEITVNKVINKFIQELEEREIEILKFDREYSELKVDFSHRGHQIQVGLRTHRDTMYLTLLDLNNPQSKQDALLRSFDNRDEIFVNRHFRIKMEHTGEYANMENSNGYKYKIESEEILQRFLCKLIDEDATFDYVANLISKQNCNYELDYVKNRLYSIELKKDEFKLLDNVLADEGLVDRVYKYLTKKRKKYDSMFKVNKDLSIYFWYNYGTFTDGGYFYEFNIQKIKYKNYVKRDLGYTKLLIQTVSEHENDYKRAFSIFMPENYERLIKYIRSVILKLDTEDSELYYTTQTYKKIPSELDIND